MDRFTSPVWCTCAITGRMHTVCDEHGSHSFKSDGLPVHRPCMHEVMSTRRQKISGQKSEAINIWMQVVILHAHGVGKVHTAIPPPGLASSSPLHRNFSKGVRFSNKNFPEVAPQNHVSAYLSPNYYTAPVPSLRPWSRSSGCVFDISGQWWPGAYMNDDM